MANVLLIISQRNFRDEELKLPLQMMKNAGHKCVVASITTDRCYGMLGMEQKPDITVKAARVDDYDAIVVIGGSGSPELGNHIEVLQLLKDAKAKGKVIAAICLAPMVLAKAGVLAGRRATVFQMPNSIEALNRGGAVFADRDVVDGNVVTACGPQVAADFAINVMKLL